MARQKMVDGVIISFTAEEEAEADAMEVQWLIDSQKIPVPNAVSMRQARLALLGAGLLANVNAALAAMTGIEGEAARIEWEYATEVRRDSALVSGLAGALGLTDEQLDALFITAGGL